MVAQLATVAVVPRERFSFAQRSLEHLLTHSEQPLDLIYVDGGSPPNVREYLERQASLRDFRLIRTNHFLAPNVARNLALAQVRTKYVVFIDNDVLVSPGWLSKLVDCAESTGAWVVGPTYCEREPIATRIHMAGGRAEIVSEHGRRVFYESHRFCGQPLAKVGPSLRREPVQMIEFHCVLVRMDAFERLGPLDEQLMSAAEHTDLCLLARAAGGQVFLEPESIVTYVGPPPLEPSDLEYYQLRWSHAWNKTSLERFREKWELEADDPGLASLETWLADHRRLALEPYRRVLRVFGRRPARWMERTFIAPFEEAANRARFPYRSAATTPASRMAA